MIPAALAFVLVLDSSIAVVPRPAQLTRQLGDGGGAGAGVVQVALG